MNFINIIKDTTAFHDKCIHSWKKNGLKYTKTGFLHLIEMNHSYNYQLWLAEDNARIDDKGFEFVYKAKRIIDKCNQQRNDYIEKMDKYLFENIQPADDCPLNSETPGMMIDRLSILSLKIYHMNLQLLRKDTEPLHLESCKQKVNVLNMQREQLHSCLTVLIDECINKMRTFKVYYQFKMYNDPAFKLNITTD